MLKPQADLTLQGLLFFSKSFVLRVTIVSSFMISVAAIMASGSLVLQTF